MTNQFYSSNEINNIICLNYFILTATLTKEHVEVSVSSSDSDGESFVSEICNRTYLQQWDIRTLDLYELIKLSFLREPTKFNKDSLLLLESNSFRIFDINTLKCIKEVKLSTDSPSTIVPISKTEYIWYDKNGLLNVCNTKSDTPLREVNIGNIVWCDFISKSLAVCI
jgi:hypothetical protein